MEVAPLRTLLQNGSSTCLLSNNSLSENSATSGCFEDPAFFAYLLFDLASFSFFMELLGVTTVPAVQRISDLYPQYVKHDLKKTTKSPDFRLRKSGEEIVFTGRPKINSHSQIFRYGRSIFCLPHRPKFSDFFDLCLHWVSIVRGPDHQRSCIQ